MKNAALFLVVLGALSACSGIARREDERVTAARYREYAGEPIENFSYLGRLDGWRALSRDQLVVWTGLNKAYLLTVAGSGTDLPSATRIGITSKTGNVSRGFDTVLLHRGQRCTIAAIRPIDYARMKQDEAELRGS